ncbi:hypothetical protein QQS21_009041 [Conoideocrella luteorostrata]|uniref:S-adenosyl-L-methionine-dependent methyltransferase n=1 Tax=Conoideocrella luteorostrata TaxID=1105319 RepID=A0AAJ0CKE1_9HYPO|nr:hypothetical protein QQS21_009041 [Conoideocrella luteorostrata]
MHSNISARSGGATSGDFEFTFELIPEVNPLPIIEDVKLKFSRDAQSISSSIENFIEEFGRTYHAYKEGSYHFPNDPRERDRLDKQNRIISNMLCGGRLHFAPFSKQNPPRRVLDVATGTGDWAIQMGDEYPTSYVEGLDLSPIQPREVPLNVRFFVQDASEPWHFHQPFDYIHTRLTLGCFADFKAIVQQAFDNLEPGGLFESVDLMAVWHSDDGSLDANGAFASWFKNINVASEAIERPLSVASKLKGWYEEVGFVDVQEKVYKIPLNGWPEDPHMREIGNEWQSNLLDGLSGFTLGLFSRVLGYTEEEIQLTLMNVRKEIQDTTVHAYEPLYVVWGRKPSSSKSGN